MLQCGGEEREEREREELLGPQSTLSPHWDLHVAGTEQASQQVCPQLELLGCQYEKVEQTDKISRSPQLHTPME